MLNISDAVSDILLIYKIYRTYVYRNIHADLDIYAKMLFMILCIVFERIT